MNKTNYCPTNEYNCPYYRENGICNLKCPEKDCIGWFLYLLNDNEKKRESE